MLLLAVAVSAVSDTRATTTIDGPLAICNPAPLPVIVPGGKLDWNYEIAWPTDSQHFFMESADVHTNMTAFDFEARPTFAVRCVPRPGFRSDFLRFTDEVREIGYVLMWKGGSSFYDKTAQYYFEAYDLRSGKFLWTGATWTGHHDSHRFNFALDDEGTMFVANWCVCLALSLSCLCGKG